LNLLRRAKPLLAQIPGASAVDEILDFARAYQLIGCVRCPLDNYAASSLRGCSIEQ
jgi:hypothetical protein